MDTDIEITVTNLRIMVILFLMLRTGARIMVVRARIMVTHIQIMQILANTLEKHKAALLEKGMKETLPTEIDEACKSLDVKGREQIEVIKSCPGITHKRIEKMNDLW